MTNEIFTTIRIEHGYFLRHENGSLQQDIHITNIMMWPDIVMLMWPDIVMLMWPDIVMLMWP